MSPFAWEGAAFVLVVLVGCLALIFGPSFLRRRRISKRLAPIVDELKSRAPSSIPLPSPVEQLNATERRLRDAASAADFREAVRRERQATRRTSRKAGRKTSVRRKPDA